MAAFLLAITRLIFSTCSWSRLRHLQSLLVSSKKKWFWSNKPRCYLSLQRVPTPKMRISVRWKSLIRQVTKGRAPEFWWTKTTVALYLSKRRKKAFTMSYWALSTILSVSRASNLRILPPSRLLQPQLPRLAIHSVSAFFLSGETNRLRLQR